MPLQSNLSATFVRVAQDITAVEAAAAQSVSTLAGQVAQDISTLETQVGLDITALEGRGSVASSPTVAHMVSRTDLAIGDVVATLGYHAAGDGGGNTYEIVAGGTGTADGGSYINVAAGLQSRGLFPSGICWNQFGAKGDAHVLNATPTDDRAAMQACVNFARTLTQAYEETGRTDNGKQQSTQVYIDPAQGASYGISAPVTWDNKLRNMVIRGGTFVAIGAGWLATEFMFNPAGVFGSRVTFSECKINCGHVAGGVDLRAFSFVDGCTISAFAGTGVRLNGSTAKATRCMLYEWDMDEPEHYDYTNYTGVGIHFAHTDCAIEDCLVKWSAELIRVSAPMWRIKDTHLTNGMQNHADPQDGGTRLWNPVTAGTPRPGGGVLLNIVDGGGAAYMGDCDNVYFDNGIIINYNHPVNFKDCKMFAMDSACPASEEFWYHIYADTPTALDQTSISDCYVAGDNFDKKWITWKAEGVNAWTTDHAPFEAHADNVAALRGKPFSFNTRATSFSQFKEQAYRHGLSTELKEFWQSRTSTGPIEWGVNGDNFEIDTPAAGTLFLNGKPMMESGTFTVTLADETGNSVLQPGKTVTYVRIGDHVTYFFNFINNLDTTGLVATDSVQIVLPFTNAAHSFSSVELKGIATAPGPYHWYAMSGTTSLFIRVIDWNTRMKVSDLTSGVSDITGGTLTVKV